MIISSDLQVNKPVSRMSDLATEKSPHGSVVSGTQTKEDRQALPKSKSVTAKLPSSYAYAREEDLRAAWDRNRQIVDDNARKQRIWEEGQLASLQVVQQDPLYKRLYPTAPVFTTVAEKLRHLQQSVHDLSILRPRIRILTPVDTTGLNVTGRDFAISDSVALRDILLRHATWNDTPNPSSELERQIIARKAETARKGYQRKTSKFTELKTPNPSSVRKEYGKSRSERPGGPISLPRESPPFKKDPKVNYPLAQQEWNALKAQFKGVTLYHRPRSRAEKIFRSRFLVLTDFYGTCPFFPRFRIHPRDASKFPGRKEKTIILLRRALRASGFLGWKPP